MVTMAPIMPAVSAPPEAWRALSRLASIGARVLTAQSGGLPLADGLAQILGDVDAAGQSGASPRRTPAASVEPRELTTAQAAAVMGVTQRRVQQLAAQQKIVARKAGRDYLVDQRAAEQWRDRRCRYR